MTARIDLVKAMLKKKNLQPEFSSAGMQIHVNGAFIFREAVFLLNEYACRLQMRVALSLSNYYESMIEQILTSIEPLPVQ